MFHADSHRTRSQRIRCRLGLEWPDSANSSCLADYFGAVATNQDHESHGDNHCRSREAYSFDLAIALCNVLALHLSDNLVYPRREHKRNNNLSWQRTLDMTRSTSFRHKRTGWKLSQKRPAPAMSLKKTLTITISASTGGFSVRPQLLGDSMDGASWAVAFESSLGVTGRLVDVQVGTVREVEHSI